jgi:hypothetical protein
MNKTAIDPLIDRVIRHLRTNQNLARLLHCTQVAGPSLWLADTDAVQRYLDFHEQAVRQELLHGIRNEIIIPYSADWYFMSGPERQYLTRDELLQHAQFIAEQSSPNGRPEWACYAYEVRAWVVPGLVGGLPHE